MIEQVKNIVFNVYYQKIRHELKRLYQIFQF